MRNANYILRSYEITATAVIMVAEVVVGNSTVSAGTYCTEANRTKHKLLVRTVNY